MEPRRALENLFDRIRRKLGIFNPALLKCSLCGKRVAAMRKAIMREETDGVPLCQSCFELMLQKAAQAPR